MKVALEDLAVERGQLVLEDLDRSIRAPELDPEVAALGDGHRLLVAEEIAARHVGDVGLVVGLPGAEGSILLGFFWAYFFTERGPGGRSCPGAGPG